MPGGNAMTPFQQQERVKRFAALHNRATRPNQDRFYRHAERFEIIDTLLKMKLDWLMVDCMNACLEADRSDLQSAIFILTQGDLPRLDSTGGLLFVSLSTEAAEALKADARRCHRDPERQALAILEAYLGLYLPDGSEIDVSQEDISRALSEIEWLTREEGKE